MHTSYYDKVYELLWYSFLCLGKSQANIS